jgi:hypothetical protein
MGTLKIAPSSLTLRCNRLQQAGVVTLRNTGSRTIEWAASVKPEQNGIRVFPSNGQLEAGDSRHVIVFSFALRGAQQGTILFQARDSATTAQTLTYTLAGCS